MLMSSCVPLFTSLNFMAMMKLNHKLLIVEFCSSLIQHCVQLSLVLLIEIKKQACNKRGGNNVANVSAI